MTNSTLIDNKIEETYEIVRENAEKKKRQKQKRRFVQVGIAAAAIVVAIGFCGANPALAKELPLIGSVIERVQELLGFREIPYFFLYPKGASKETVRGSWKFQELSIAQSDKKMQVIEINETNAAGFGLDRIEISPVELTVYDKYPEDHLVMTIVLDNGGRKLAYAGNNTNELAVSGYDLSEITVYLYDYDEYMEIKGLAYKDPQVFRDTLEKNALYRKQIFIEE